MLSHNSIRVNIVSDVEQYKHPEQDICPMTITIILKWSQLKRIIFNMQLSHINSFVNS